MKKYLWQEKDGDSLNGLFDSVEEAKKNGFEEAQSFFIEIFDARPAEPDDAELFGEENTSQFGWWANMWVPENLVGEFRVPFENVAGVI